MDAFDTISACKTVEEFLEILNNWYIRRSRERFWKTQKDADKLSAYNTLYSVLHMLCRAISPLMPLVTEEIYLGLTDAQKSIHLEEFPQVALTEVVKDKYFIQCMDKVRDACSAALFIRNEAGIRVRQPLKSVTFIGVSEFQKYPEFQELVLDETNVKEWINLEKSEIEKYATYKLAIKFPVLGKRLPHKIKDIIVAQKQNAWKIIEGQLHIAGETLNSDEYEMLLETKPEFLGRIAPLPSNDALVMLDLEVSEELKLEGIARDLVRAVQQARKDAGFNITDRIKVSFYVNDNDIKTAISHWDSYIKEQTLASDIFNAKEESFHNQEIEFDGKKVIVGVKKV